MDVIKKLEIRNDLGLHARSAAKIVQLAAKYKSRIFLKKNNMEVDGTSILSIITLECPKGTEVEVKITGEDSKKFMQDIEKLFEEKFGEN